MMKNCDDMLSRFQLSDTGTLRTDRQTDRFAISISRVSMLTRDKNRQRTYAYGLDWVFWLRRAYPQEPLCGLWTEKR